MESLNDGTAEFDLAVQSVRELNAELHAPNAQRYVVRHPRGAHAVAAGVDGPLDVLIDGDVGYYCAGMNQEGLITVDGSAGPGVAENMMSGVVRIRGHASQSAGATSHGGLLIIEGNASTRCGISLKGGEIVIGGDMGAMGAFMAQAGRIVVCGDAGDGLGDSIYEAEIFVRGSVGTLGADCIEKEMRPDDREALKDLLVQAGMAAQAETHLDEFRRYGSARTLYHFTHEHAGSY